MAATKYAQAVQKDTKDFITTAMLQLLAKEKMSNITVTQVCKRAGVSRMAFYRNFNDLDQILYAYFQPKIAAIFNTIRQNSEEAVKYEIQFNFFNEFDDKLLLSINHGFESIIQRIFVEEIESFYAEDDEYWTAFISAGVYAIWRKWLLDGRQRPLKDIMAFLKKANAIEISSFNNQNGAIVI